jgi:serine/tyrosine/threonine adenylyltransferase
MAGMSAVLDLPAVDLRVQWRNSFASLGPAFYTRLAPTPLPDPYLVALNRALASELRMDATQLASPEGVAALTGNRPLAGSDPLASVYSGHQFGVWAGQLGDGRAILLGEVDTPAGPQELQLKGSGRTPYSRMGDGRAVLRSSIREFLGSEAMHGLGIPTTRALIVTGSDAPVRRE